ncbi:MAG: D-alanyl-D-alanine carboxypeptidase [Desulfobacterales bacterium]
MRPAGRILLTNNSDEITRYAGQMFHFFLADQGITVMSDFRLSKKEDKTSRTADLPACFSLPLPDVIARLLNTPNNFIANQLLLAARAAAYGPPATMEKGVKAAQHFIRENFEAAALFVVEGVSISRNNRCTARGFFRRSQEIQTLAPADDM